MRRSGDKRQLQQNEHTRKGREDDEKNWKALTMLLPRMIFRCEEWSRGDMKKYNVNWGRKEKMDRKMMKGERKREQHFSACSPLLNNSVPCPQCSAPCTPRPWKRSSSICSRYFSLTSSSGLHTWERDSVFSYQEATKRRNRERL